jgi:hypothetical protein
VGTDVLALDIPRDAAVGSRTVAAGAVVGATVAGLDRDRHAATPSAAPVASMPVMNFLRFNMAVILSLM